MKTPVLKIIGLRSAGSPGVSLNPGDIVVNTTTATPDLSSQISILPLGLDTSTGLDLPSATGRIGITPQSVTASTSLQNPLLSALINIAPDGSQLSTTLSTPDATTGGGLLPADLFADSLIDNPALSNLAQQINPADIQADSSLMTPDVQTIISFVVSGVQVNAQLDDTNIVLPNNLLPDSLQVNTSIDVVVIQTKNSLLPSDLVLSSSLADAVLALGHYDIYLYFKLAIDRSIDFPLFISTSLKFNGIV